jgi:hypothetical protein
MDLYEHSNTKGAVSLTFEGCAKGGRCRSFMTLVNNDSNPHYYVIHAKASIFHLKHLLWSCPT